MKKDISISRPWAWFFLIIFLLFSYMRFTGLTDRPLHNDEGVNGFFSDNLIKENNWQYNPSNYHGPTLYYFQLITSWTTAFLKDPLHFKWSDNSGLTIFSTRFTTAFTSLIVLAGFLLCRPFLGFWGLLLALVLAGTSCSFLFYSRYFIHEVFVVAFTFGFFLSLAYFRKTKRSIFFILAAVSASLLFCTKETGIIHLFICLLAYLVASAVSLFIDGKSLKNSLLEAWRMAFHSIRLPVRHALVALAIAIAIWGLFYSSFFKNPQGLVDSFTAYLPWAKEGFDSGHNKPWWYFIKDLLMGYELPLLILASLGGCLALIRNDKPGLFYLFWSLGMISFYSIIPYKTPWCVINFVVPMALLAGRGLQLMLDLALTSKEISSKNRTIGVTASGISLLIAFHLMNTWTTNYKEYDLEQNKFSYVHTSRDVSRLLSTIEDIGKKTGEGKTILIHSVSPEYWPLPFYLKDYPSAKFWGTIEGVEPLDAPLIISLPNQHTDLNKKLKDTYSIQSFTLRPGLILDLWINNNFVEGTQPPQTILELRTSAASQSNLASGLTHEVFAGLGMEGDPERIDRQFPFVNFYYDSEEKKPLRAPFSIRWTGFLQIPDKGLVQFHLDSDDGSWLYLDDVLVIDNGGNHALARKSRTVDMSAGLHKLELRYSDVGGFAEMRLSWTLPKKEEEEIPERYFFSAQ